MKKIYLSNIIVLFLVMIWFSIVALLFNIHILLSIGLSLLFFGLLLFYSVKAYKLKFDNKQLITSAIINISSSVLFVMSFYYTAIRSHKLFVQCVALTQDAFMCGKKHVSSQFVLIFYLMILIILLTLSASFFYRGYKKAKES